MHVEEEKEGWCRGLQQNKEKISDLMVETKEIQNVLNTIFEEESQTEAIEITSTKQNVENNDTIDERYLEFAKIILEKEENILGYEKIGKLIKKFSMNLEIF